MKPFYKSKIWYSYLILAAFFGGMLIFGLYECCFVEQWYDAYSWVINYDIIMSFLSVQVNIMSIVWLVFLVINYDRRGRGITSEGFTRSLLNWNLIVFIIFWIGIIYSFVEGEMKLNLYTKNQIACTIATHFVCPLYIFIMYLITSGTTKLSYTKFWKEKDIYIAGLYPFCYLFYVYFRGLIYMKDLSHSTINGDRWYHEQATWPYPFTMFEKSKLFVGNSVAGYIILLIVVFALWIYLQHIFLIWVNNAVHNFKNKHSEKIITWWKTKVLRLKK
ncbi:hypothetical protein SHELI_v1c11090 [Spiroplasma helicoides]|uniref:Uncharacterized protein n=1 Tax=Spiroplasma helicoides TaxID=216938 RepID=A0A1B3SM98_9MOLU|nr:hypothetical protein [Spiroplasma helicoides]AOG61056.1 hypothetical protein SHELI_v1c11090 [Spiroplasma helicoides]